MAKKLYASKGFLLTAVGLALSQAMAFAYLTDRTAYAPINYYIFRPPDAGGTYLDPTFGTSIKRISNSLLTPDAADAGNLTLIVNEYSTMSPFNRDNSRMILQHQSYFALYDGLGNYIRDLPLQVGSASEPRWSRGDADVLYFLRGNQLNQFNVATNTITIAHTFSEYLTINGAGESDICFDGNHLVLIGDTRYIFVYEISSDTKGPVFDTGGYPFDNVHITPNDNVIVAWYQAGSDRYNGVELFDRNMNFLRQVVTVAGHLDVTRDINGDEVLVWINAADPLALCSNSVVKIRLADGQQTCLISLDWNLAVHISAPDNEGSVLVSTYSPIDLSPSAGWQPFANEIFELKLDGSELRRLAHHRSRPFNTYYFTPRAAVSRDGTRLVYSSNYGLQSILGYPSQYSDAYLVDLSSPAPSYPGSDARVATRFEQSEAQVTYSGTWYSNAIPPHSDGSAVLAMDTGAKATFNFTGTGVAWIGYRDEWSGIAKVYVDDELKATVDTFASPALSQALLFSMSGLSAGNHSLRIEVAGERNPSSGGTWVWIDAFDVSDRFEQDNAAVLYSGTWYTNTIPYHSGGTAVLAMEPGTRATFSFTGTAVSWIGYRDEWSGIARVYLDGTLRAELDTYASPFQAQQVVYTINGMSPAAHTFTIEVAGKKNPASGGWWVWIDAFEVVP